MVGSSYLAHVASQAWAGLWEVGEKRGVGGGAGRRSKAGEQGGGRREEEEEWVNRGD